MNKYLSYFVLIHNRKCFSNSTIGTHSKYWACHNLSKSDFVRSSILRYYSEKYICFAYNSYNFSSIRGKNTSRIILRH